MKRRELLATASAASAIAVAGCTGGGNVDGELVLDETVIGGGNLFFEAEAGDTINFWGEIDGTGQAAAVVTSREGEGRIVEERVTTDTTASGQTENSGDHVLTIASGPTVTMDVEIGIE